MATVAVKVDDLMVRGRYTFSLQGGLGITGVVLSIHRGMVRVQLDDADAVGAWLRFPQSWINKAWRVWGDGTGQQN